MAGERVPLRVVLRSRVLKYEEGADPQKDMPFEIREKEHVLEGQEAEEFINRNRGGNDNAVIE